MLDKIVALDTWVKPRPAVSDQLARNQRNQNTDASQVTSRVVRGGKVADVDSGSTWDEEWCRLFEVNKLRDEKSLTVSRCVSSSFTSGSYSCEGLVQRLDATRIVNTTHSPDRISLATATVVSSNVALY